MTRMKGFRGFPQKGTLIRIPGLFFSELLPQIDSLPELKVTLYCFWRMQQKEGQVVFLRKQEMLIDTAFMSGLGRHDDQRAAALEEGLERAITRGTLLHVRVEEDDRTDDLYFMNTARGRAAVEGIEQGKWFPEIESLIPLHVTVERPTLYRLYEQNIGPLTPLIAERLGDLEEMYPEAWITEAIGIAVANNKHKLSYVEAILKRWQEEGRGDDLRAVPDEQRFKSGKKWDEIEH